MKKILVIGSSSVDLTIELDRMPAQGETIKAADLELFCGGKGANQAVAIARLDGSVDMLGCVGNDGHGELVRENLTANQVNTEKLGVSSITSTGTAHIFLINQDNRIIIIPGANNEVTSEFVEQQLAGRLSEYSLVILQNEIPSETIHYIVNCCKKAGISVLYNPAPADVEAAQLMDNVTFLTPNETECQQIFPELTVEEAVTNYPNQLIVTLGEKGVLFHDGKELRQVPAYPVTAVDTTGAGDTFNGAFALAIVQGKSLAEASQFANKAAALSVTKKGAQQGMPTIQELEAFS
ncbi:ribokinase [Enterococcus sp. JM4C]|uniref:ribokinase n=1 Tax=Candidatus Enterococcus huntleyi TaxID=1857217 RepID=UPI00137B8CEF|nr:ribokinase [Enterococcus sp. JM4C]KAF1299386.1 ribokinase [Enterococcus sp. JM4C]